MVATVLAAGERREGATIAERALRGIGGLDALGIGEGDVVAIMLRNETAFLEAMLITRQAGCYSCPINWHYKADEAGYILRDCGAKALIVHADLLRQIEGGMPAGCHVIVVAPSAETRAAFRLTSEQSAIPSGRDRIRKLARGLARLHRATAQGARLGAVLVRHHRQAEGRAAHARRRPSNSPAWSRSRRPCSASAKACAPRSSRRSITRRPPPTACRACCSAISCSSMSGSIPSGCSPTSRRTNLTGSIWCRPISCGCCACPTR